MSAKIATAAAMPMTSVADAVMAKVGARRSDRHAGRTKVERAMPVGSGGGTHRPTGRGATGFRLAGRCQLEYADGAGRTFLPDVPLRHHDAPAVLLQRLEQPQARRTKRIRDQHSPARRDPGLEEPAEVWVHRLAVQHVRADDPVV